MPHNPRVEGDDNLTRQPGYLYSSSHNLRRRTTRGTIIRPLQAIAVCKGLLLEMQIRLAS